MGRLGAREGQPGLPDTLPGQWWDEETGLHYNRCRYYDPQIARYISQDPVRLPGRTNLYAYARNPTGWVDPFGLNGFACDDPDIKPLREQFEAGADPTTIVPDEYVVVRGGQSPMPPPGDEFSGAIGATPEQAGAGVPHRSVRATTGATSAPPAAPSPTRPNPLTMADLPITDMLTSRTDTLRFPADPSKNPAPKDSKVPSKPKT